MVAGAIPILVALVLVTWSLAAADMIGGVHGIKGDGYDDGVHVGTALRLTEFLFPYRDYVFLHPPGISLLLLPFAVIGRLTSEGVALELSRVLTAGVFVVDVALVAFLLRRRGAWAMLTGPLVLALYPLAAYVTHTTMAEVYVGLFVLLGAAVLFEERPSGWRSRPVLAGVLLGLALSLKVVAVIPVGAVLLARWLHTRKVPRREAAGIAISLVVTVLPFALLAPVEFIRDVFAAQMQRKPAFNTDSVGLFDRLATIFGWIKSPNVSQRSGLIFAIVVVFLVLLGLTVWRRRSRIAELDIAAILGLVLLTVFFLRTPDTFPQYPFLPVLFLALVCGMVVGALVEWFSQYFPAPTIESPVRMVLAVLASTAVILAVWVGMGRSVGVADDLAADAFDPSTWIEATIRPGECVVFDVPTLAIVGDRFVADGPCPATVDPFGAWLIDGEHMVPGRTRNATPELREQWERNIREADAVILSVDWSNFIPWTSVSRSLLTEQFDRFSSPSQPTIVIYRRK